MSQRNEVLRKRSVTGIVFGAIVLLLIYSGKIGAIALFSVIVIGGCHEYIRMVFPKNIRKLSYGFFVTVGIVVSIMSMGLSHPSYPYLVIISCALLLFGIVNMFTPLINHRRWYWLVSASYLGLPIGLFITYVYGSHPYPKAMVLSIIGLIWMSDTLAYLVGSRVGKTKLFERISPKKTWEGFIGGGIFTIGLVYIIQHYQSAYPLWFWLVLAAIVWIIGTSGDLVESSIKRQFDIKDSGKLLPGHGGILDRFDSLIYVLPFILLLLLQIENNLSF